MRLACHSATRLRRVPFLIALLLLARLAVSAANPEPQRIVSTSPSITEDLFALGLGPRVVGVSNYCEYPAQVKDLPRFGMPSSIEAV